MLGKSTPRSKPSTGHITAAEFRKTRPDLKPRRLKGTGKQAWVRRSPAADRTIEGITFDSKAEAYRYLELRGMKARGEIDGFLRQPVLDLAGCVYRPDFMTWHADPVTGAAVHVFEEIKGRGTHPEVLRRFRRNQTQTERIYGIPVILVEVDT